MADPTERVLLDWFESFCQFCVKLELVTMCNPEHNHSKLLTVENGVIRFSRFDLNPMESPKVKDFHSRGFNDQDRICWVDPRRTVGLKVRVRKLPSPAPVPEYAHDGEAEQYEITLQGDF